MKHYTLLVLLFFMFLIGCSDHLKNGEEMMKNGKYKETAVEFEKINQGNENYEKSREKLSESLYLHGTYLIGKNEIDSAILIFNKIPENYKDYGKARSKINYCRGMEAVNKGSYEEARKYFRNMDKYDEYYPKTEIILKEYESEIKVINNLAIRVLNSFDNKKGGAANIISKFKSYKSEISKIVGTSVKTAGNRAIKDFIRNLEDLIDTYINLQKEYEANIIHIHPINGEIIEYSEKMGTLEKKCKALKSNILSQQKSIFRD